ncbi:unnamed protein product [Coffea canephora]|uniref:FLZ-type domain-containing protein n=1 Tax=Coffea canephora TaxID=49390 RepID=A0A068TPD7_COFCA|nr:unnamed protein product [Coffea canephora]
MLRMLSTVSIWSPLKLNQKNTDHDRKINKKRSSLISSHNLQLSSTAVGLRILTAADTTLPTDHSNVVLNSALRLVKPIFRMTAANQSSHSSLTTLSPQSSYCYLGSCFLCNKTLRLDKDVYMYRGDQGFCSVECRSRQMYLDEIREVESSTKRTLASLRRTCRDSNWCEGETRTVLEEFRRERDGQAMPCQKGQRVAPIFTLS